LCKNEAFLTPCNKETNTFIHITTTSLSQPLSLKPKKVRKSKKALWRWPYPASYCTTRARKSNNDDTDDTDDDDDDDDSNDDDDD